MLCTKTLYCAYMQQLYKDIRGSVDMCHRDGVIKNAVINNPSKYIIYDPNMVPMLERYRDQGKKVSVITVYIEYTLLVYILCIVHILSVYLYTHIDTVFIYYTRYAYLYTL